MISERAAGFANSEQGAQVTLVLGNQAQGCGLLRSNPGRAKWEGPGLRQLEQHSG